MIELSFIQAALKANAIKLGLVALVLGGSYIYFDYTQKRLQRLAADKAMLEASVDLQTKTITSAHWPELSQR